MSDTPTLADQAAIAAVIQSIVEAWEKHDAKAFAATFTEDATMILPNQYRKGRADIEAFMSMGFQGPFKGTRVTGAPIDLRFFGPNSGIAVTQGGVLAPGETEVSATAAIKASWVVVKQNGQWLLAAYHNCPSA